MRLTWRDGVTTLLAGVVGLVYAAHALAWQWPVVEDARGATLVLGVVGLGMCIVGGSGGTIASRSRFTLAAGILGGAAFLLVVVGLITGWSLAVTLIAVDTLLLYAISTVRHAAAGVAAPEPA